MDADTSRGNKSFYALNHWSIFNLSLVYNLKLNTLEVAIYIKRNFIDLGYFVEGDTHEVLSVF